jgi:hypothetical protein
MPMIAAMYPKGALSFRVIPGKYLGLTQLRSNRLAGKMLISQSSIHDIGGLMGIKRQRNSYTYEIDYFVHY